MKIAGRIVILALCVLSAYAIPKALDIEPASNTVSDGAATCINAYNTQASYIDGQITDQITACLTVSTQVPQTSAENPQAALLTSEVRNSLQVLQQNLQNCLSITDDATFAECVQNDYDPNKKLWNDMNSNSHSAENKINSNENGSIGSQKGCVGEVMDHAKTNMSKAIQTCNNCLTTLLNEN